MGNKTWKDRFFTPVEVGQMEAIFNENFFEKLKSDENVNIEGYYSEGVCFSTFIIKNDDESFYYPVETKVSISDNPSLSEDDARRALLDLSLEYFEEYFLNDRELYLTIEWSAFEIGDIKMYARAQVINQKLEKMADEILSSAGLDENGNKINKK
jgi:hypothetical protein